MLQTHGVCMIQYQVAQVSPSLHVWPTSMRHFTMQWSTTFKCWSSLNSSNTNSQYKVSVQVRLKQYLAWIRQQRWSHTYSFATDIGYQGYANWNLTRWNIPYIGPKFNQSCNYHHLSPAYTSGKSLRRVRQGWLDGRPIWTQIQISTAVWTGLHSL